MRILHTSDWHIGNSLVNKKRYEEYTAFLTWLTETIQKNTIDVLLVAGDVFDTTTPSNRAQALYYTFLHRVANTCCRHVVIVGGNHDSPSLLNAPKELLKVFDIHVVGCIPESIEDEVLVLRNRADGHIPELIVCAVPYLRDRDIRVAEAGESLEDKERKLLTGIRNHYAHVAALAEQKRGELDIPIVATGHLFTAGGQTGDGVRELYVGSLAHVQADIFPTCFDYLALGHLHVPQMVHGSPILRYSGSPLPIGFGEATQRKSVCQVEFHNRQASVQLIEVPVFQQLERISGDWDAITKRIRALKKVAHAQSWLDVTYNGTEVIGDLRERLEAELSGTDMEILRIKNNRIIQGVLEQRHEGETLDDLGVDAVFERCLDVHETPEEDRPELRRAYQETLTSLYEDDAQAE